MDIPYGRTVWREASRSSTPSRALFSQLFSSVESNFFNSFLCHLNFSTKCHPVEFPFAVPHSVFMFPCYIKVCVRVLVDVMLFLVSLSHLQSHSSLHVNIKVLVAFYLCTAVPNLSLHPSIFAGNCAKVLFFFFTSCIFS